MEDSSEVHSEENKFSPENNKKRRLKTSAQVMALENFYNEHKYPTEEMKLQLAEQIGLTEKQISGWFCHRRLKDKRLLRDEAYANGRQDRSSVVIQDRASGFRQDSCGSTKQGDYKNTDPREVESRSLYGHDLPAAELNYERRSQYTGNISDMDNTSSESSSSLQDRFLSRKEDPYDMETSRYLTKNGAVIPKNSNAKNMGYKPSGYLKVKGEIENAAITAVRRQLGRHYREDGPQLGVKFHPLPPGAFESPTSHPVNEPFYVRDSRQDLSPDLSRGRKQSNHDTKYEVYNSKLSSQDSYKEGVNRDTLRGSDCEDGKSHGQLRQSSPFLNYSSRFPGQKSSLDMHEDSAGETSVYDIKRINKMSSKYIVEGIRSDSGSNHHGLYGGKITSEQTKPWLHDYDNVSPKIVRNGEYLSKPSNVTLGCGNFIETEERGLSTRMAKEVKHYAERKAMKKYHDLVRVKMHPTNEMTVAKRVKTELPHQDYVTKTSYSEIPTEANQIKRSAVEMPSSFSEDETAETSSSSD